MLSMVLLDETKDVISPVSTAAGLSSLARNFLRFNFFRC
jgi:hypothetical protein